jgi:hypothetical protein
MLVIRHEQIKALSANTRAQFETRLADHVIAHFPEKVWNLKMPDDLRQRISAAVDRAIAWRFEWEDEVAWFVMYTFELGEHFDTDPEYSWVCPILEDRTTSGYQKIEAIEEGLCDD